MAETAVLDRAYSNESGTNWSSPRAHADAVWLADTAVSALIDEANLTPKPALVDQRGSGAHADLDLKLMHRSARSLRPGFMLMALAASGSAPERALRERLAAIGREAERAMFAVTEGSNAHRGAIWIVGLLIASAAMTRHREPHVVATTAALIARYPDRHIPPLTSHGARVRARYGAAGARGEALGGFPHAVDIGLPALHASRARGDSENDARLNALIAIVAVLEDTCLLHRGGEGALRIAQHGARRILACEGVGTVAGRAALWQLDADLLARNASPGGGADLLAATLFLDRIQREGRRETPSLQE